MSFPTQRSEGVAAGADAPLTRLNGAAHDVAVTALLGCCGSHRWAVRLAAHRPYPNVEALLAAADEASYDMTAADLAEALADETAPHPLDGEPQQSTLAAHTALRAAQAAYESRFKHTFLLCLDGCLPKDRLDHTLDGIRTRLENDHEQEWAITAEELRRVARGRLARLATSGTV